MRLDRFLGELNLGTRSQVKGLIRRGAVTVNGIPALNPDQRIDEATDRVALHGKELQYRRFVYYMLNKPEGVVSATRDNVSRTVVALLGKDAREDIFPVGRLDKDVTGLLLLTNDGELAHRLLSPKRHVDKTYLAVLAHGLRQADIRRLESGVDIGEERPTLPARVEVAEYDDAVFQTDKVSEARTVCPARAIRLTLHEGKFHQVKRMLQAVDNEVVSLRRIAFGGLCLDPKLRPGEYRELTGEELKILRTATAGDTEV